MVSKARRVVAHNKDTFQMKRARSENDANAGAGPSRANAIRSAREIFGISESIYKARKADKVCFSCGEKHMVPDCPSATEAQKAEYRRLVEHAKAKREGAQTPRPPHKKAKRDTK